MKRDFKFTPLTLSLIKRHLQEGKTREESANLVGCDTATWDNICRKHGLSSAPVFQQSLAAADYTTMATKIPNTTLDIIEREAKRRGYLTPDLVARVLDLVANDDLFSAVLDG